MNFLFVKKKYEDFVIFGRLNQIGTEFLNQMTVHIEN